MIVEVGPMLIWRACPASFIGHWQLEREISGGVERTLHIFVGVLMSDVGRRPRSGSVPPALSG